MPVKIQQLSNSVSTVSNATRIIFKSSVFDIIQCNVIGISLKLFMGIAD